MTSLSLLIWGFCLFFLLTWIFILGILVGRGFFPGTVTAISDLKNQARRLQNMVAHNRSYESESKKKAESDPKLVFYEKLSSKKGEAKQKSAAMETTGQERVAHKGSAEVKMPASMKSESNTELIKYRPIEEIKEALLKNNEAHKNQFLENKTLGNGDFFTIQLASLTEKESAKKMIDRLINLGYPAFFYNVQVKGKTHYRVLCGRFNNRTEAAVYAVRLERDAGIRGFVSRME